MIKKKAVAGGIVALAAVLGGGMDPQDGRHGDTGG